jgi:hypothetical protein
MRGHEFEVRRRELQKEILLTLRKMRKQEEKLARLKQRLADLSVEEDQA